MRTPSNWATFSFRRKMEYLCETHQAQNFSEAAKMLRRKQREAFMPSKQKHVAYWYNN